MRYRVEEKKDHTAVLTKLILCLLIVILVSFGITLAYINYEINQDVKKHNLLLELEANR